MTHDKMGQVLRLANSALMKHELPIACIIFFRDEVIAQAYTTETQDKRLLVHAEINALMQLDQLRYKTSDKAKMELYTNLEPCMMCLGASVASFIGQIVYSLEAPSDGAARWAQSTWEAYHSGSAFQLPRLQSGIRANESRELFQNYIELHQTGPLVTWVKTLI